MLELWGMQSTFSLPSLPGPHWPEAPDRVLCMDQIELNCVLMLNWIVWNRTVFDIETVYICKTELSEIELFICIKMDLAWITYIGCCTIKRNQIKPN